MPELSLLPELGLKNHDSANYSRDDDECLDATRAADELQRCSVPQSKGNHVERSAEVSRCLKSLELQMSYRAVRHNNNQ
eukprot:6850525-Pyramimonas_sp.AAC.1